MDVVFVRTSEPYRLHVRFADGLEGVVEAGDLIRFRGVFEKLKDPSYFAKARVSRTLGTVVWPNGADIAPDTLYELVASGRVAKVP